MPRCLCGAIDCPSCSPRHLTDEPELPTCQGYDCDKVFDPEESEAKRPEQDRSRYCEMSIEGPPDHLVARGDEYTHYPTFEQMSVMLGLKR